MTKPTRLTGEQAMAEGVPEIEGVPAMVAHLSRLETPMLERMFAHGGNLLAVAEGPPYSEATDKIAAFMECISMVFVARAEAGEISPDHPVLVTRRRVYARAAEIEGRA